MVATWVVAAAFTACAGTGPEPAKPAATGPSSPSDSSPAGAAAGSGAIDSAPSRPPTGVETLIAISYAGGRVSGVGSRAKVALGSAVLLRVTSDVADTLHLHGYDKQVPLVAGSAAELRFTASMAGGFELELEGLGKTLTQIQVE